MKNALLIGNGLNRLSELVDFSNLLKGLAARKGKNYESLSFLPLEFERVYGERNGPKSKQTISKYELKKTIKKAVEEKKTTDAVLPLLKKFTELPIKHIMTTNYDYNLEKAFKQDFNRKNSPKDYKERLYSLQRKIMPDYQPYKAASKVIWHIHGEAAMPDSICLGFEQYCAQLAAMRKFLTKPDDEEIPSLTHFLESGNIEPSFSWLTLFFTHNIYIVGLSLSFMEIDLWWLLTYRYQYQLKYSGSRNRIIYFHKPESEPKECKETRDKLLLMKALGVEAQAIGTASDDWVTFYNLVLTALQKVR